MRLQEIYTICLDVNKIWETPTFQEIKSTGTPTYFKLTERLMVLKILSALEQISSLAEYIHIIRNTSMSLSQEADNIFFDANNKNIFIREFNNLKLRVDTLTDLFQSFGYEPVEGIDVKLPSNISLTDLSNCTKDLNIIFSNCVFLTNSDGNITFSSVDVGSTWLNFLITGSAVTLIAKMIASLIDKAIILRSHYITTKQQQEQMRTLQLSNDHLEKQKEIYAEYGKALLDSMSRELASENNINAPEDIERIKVSIKLMSDWMEKGMELYASVKCPNDIKAVFPPIETQYLSPKNMEMLSSGDTEDSSEK